MKKFGNSIIDYKKIKKLLKCQFGNAIIYANNTKNHVGGYKK